MSENDRKPPMFVQQQPGMPLVMLDRIGRPIQPGQLVMFKHSHDLLMEVVSVNPVLHPNAPPGLMQIVLHTEDFPFNSRSGVPASDIVIVGMSNGAKQEAPRGIVHG